MTREVDAGNLAMSGIKLETKRMRTTCPTSAVSSTSTRAASNRS
jgi:hypothetical protein